jgi:hypothetical protein
MADFLIRGANPYDLSMEDLEALAQELRENAEVDVTAEEPREFGYGVTLEQVLHIVQQVEDLAIDTAGVLTVMNIAIQWARRRWRSEAMERGEKNARPRRIILFGPDGQAIRNVLIDQPNGDAQEIDPEGQEGS